MPYAVLTTVAAVKQWIKQKDGTADDGVITTTIAIASELIGRYCARVNLGEILTYSAEVYMPKNRGRPQFSWDLPLKHWPIVSLASVIANSTAQIILTPTTLMAGSQGVMVEAEDEPRALKFFGVALTAPAVVLVSYTAGYATPPLGVSQACAQYVMEIIRSNGFVDQKSISAAGETTSFDMGGAWGMSNRVQAMLAPYRDMSGWGTA